MIDYNHQIMQIPAFFFQLLLLMMMMIKQILFSRIMATKRKFFNKYFISNKLRYR